ncbi:hypothetical protein BDN67DRAFT_974546 [Paxillus ammoniavirescens]|nr:hypothetical protein BDN67DRAFT_974546 [Paxillus ammoniavirescens]
MARMTAPLVTTKAQPARCHPTIASHTHNASETLSASSNATPPTSASPARLYEVASGALPNTIIESARFTSSPPAFDTITHALVTVPTGIGTSIASQSAQFNTDYSSGSALPSNKYVTILVGSVLGGIAFISILALTLISYRRGRCTRSRCHVNPNLKKRHLSVTPVHPTGSGEEGRMVITPFPHSSSGVIIIGPGGPADAGVGEEEMYEEWRVSPHRFAEDRQSEHWVCDSASASNNHQVSSHTRPTTPMPPTPPVLHWSAQMTPEWSAMVLEEIQVQAGSRCPHSGRCHSCEADAGVD